MISGKKSLKQIDGCLQALQCIVTEMCTMSKVSTKYYKECLSKMHLSFSSALRTYQFYEIKQALQMTKEIQQKELSYFQLKLFYLHMMYSTLTDEVNRVMIEDLGLVSLKDKHNCVLELMKDSFKSEQHSILSKHWSWLRPKVKHVPKYKKLSYIQVILRKSDTTPNNYQEEQDNRMMHVIAERYLPRTNPEMLLLLLENVDNKTIRKFLSVLNSDCSMSVIKHLVLNVLPARYVKALKLILLLHSRSNDLTISYDLFDELRLKCLAIAPPSQKHLSPECNFIVCEYCKEILTFRDIGKRPRSFGIFLQTEMMEMRCFRDDSDKLKCLTCFQMDKFVTLSLGQPDRALAGLCHGKRSCFASAGYGDRLCNACYTDVSKKNATILNMNANTCLTDRNENDMCITCREVHQKLQADNFDIKSFQEMEEEAKSNKCALPRAKTDVGTKKRKGNRLYIFDFAEACKKRKRLIQ